MPCLELVLVLVLARAVLAPSVPSLLSWTLIEEVAWTLRIENGEPSFTLHVERGWRLEVSLVWLCIACNMVGWQSGERRETREERELRHKQKAAAIQAHRSKVTTRLSRQSSTQKLRGGTSFHCPLKFDNRCGPCFHAS